MSSCFAKNHATYLNCHIIYYIKWGSFRVLLYKHRHPIIQKHLFIVWCWCLQNTYTRIISNCYITNTPKVSMQQPPSLTRLYGKKFLPALVAIRCSFAGCSCNHQVNSYEFICSIKRSHKQPEAPQTAFDRNQGTSQPQSRVHCYVEMDMKSLFQPCFNFTPISDLQCKIVQLM